MLRCAQGGNSPPFSLGGGLGTLGTPEVFGDISAFSQFLALIRNLRWILPLVWSLEGAWETYLMAGVVGWCQEVRKSQYCLLLPSCTRAAKGSGHTVVGCFSFLSVPSPQPSHGWNGQIRVQAMYRGGAEPGLL